jgi:rod shape-determining protein MreC
MQRGAERARTAINTRDSAEFATDTNTVLRFEAHQLDIENERLRGLLSLGSRIQTGFVAAQAMHGPALGEEHTLVLNVGSNAGVVPFSPVVSSRGVVGYVRSADESSSVAIAWPHPDFRVSAIAANGAAAGIVAAHLAEGPSRYLLEFRGVPFRSPLDSGALVVSSGVGGTFPAGIAIGTVVRQLDGAEGWERNYLLLPSARTSDVESVLILLPGKMDADFKSIWENPDAARARVVVAGDSIRRLIADSLRRVIGDSIRRAKMDSVRAAVADSLRKAAARRDTTRRLP